MDGHHEGRRHGVPFDELEESRRVPAVHQYDVGAEQRRPLAIRHGTRVVQRGRNEMYPVGFTAEVRLQHHHAPAPDT